MNKVILTGNLTRDPDIDETRSGKVYAKMSIAVKRPYSKNGNSDVDFFNLTAWEHNAKFCQKYFGKGSRVLVEGRLQTYSYDGKDGKKSGIDIQVENIEFAGSKRDKAVAVPANVDNDFGNDDRDMPF